MSVLHAVLAAADRALAAHAVADPGPARFDSVSLSPARRFVLEAVYEGQLLHHGSPRLYAEMDDDLRLLAGDALYALGLAKLAEAGDLAAVAELANLISRSAQAHVEDRMPDVEPFWDETARSLAS